MEQLCNEQSNRDVILAALAIAYALVEYWLGKTQKTKSGSVVELIVTAVALLVIAKFRKKEDANDSEERS